METGEVPAPKKQYPSRYPSDLTYIQQFLDWIDGAGTKPTGQGNRIVGILHSIWPEAEDLKYDPGNNDARFFRARGSRGGGTVTEDPHAEIYLQGLRRIAGAVATLGTERSEGRVVVASLNIPVKKYLGKAITTLREHHDITVELDQSTLLRDMAPEHLWAPGNPHPDYALVATDQEPPSRYQLYGADLVWKRLYSWNVAVIGGDFKPGSHVTLDEVAAAATHGPGRILVSPFGRAGRKIIDYAIAANPILASQYRDIQFLAAQDTQTRVALAEAGYGIALAPVDALPGRLLGKGAQPPLLKIASGLLEGFYGCVWAESNDRVATRDRLVLKTLRDAARNTYSNAEWGVRVAPDEL